MTAVALAGLLLLAVSPGMSGKVLDDEGAPLGGVSVEVVVVEGTRLRHETIAITRADGTFELTGVQPGQMLTFRRSGHQVGLAMLLPRRALEVKLARAATVAGVVRHVGLASGVEPPPVKVAVGDTVVEAGRDGSFLADHLAPGTYRVELLDEPGVSRQVTVARGERHTVELTVSWAGRISGVVLDWRGAPVDLASITAVPDVPGKPRLDMRTTPYTTTDLAGRFRLDGLGSGDWKLLVGGMSRQHTTVAPVRAGTPGLHITLARGGVIRGRVSGPSGPIASFRVNGERFVDAGGRFEVDMKGRERMALTVEAPGFVAARRRVESTGQAPIDLGELRLEPGHRLSGRVTDDTGNPVADAFLTSLLPGGGFVFARADAAGRYSTDGAPAGPFVLDVNLRGWATAKVNVAAGATTVDVVIGRGLRVTGRVVDERGRPMTDVRLALDGTAVTPSAEKDVQVEPDGTFELSGLGPGTLELTPSSRSAWVPVTVISVSEGAAPLVIHGRTGGVGLEVVFDGVDDPEWLELIGPDGGKHLPSRADPWVFPALAPGRYTLVGEDTERGEFSDTVDIGTTNVSVTFDE